MTDVRMPQLGESVAEGTVTKWLVREGDFVEREQVLLTVATDKADTEIRAPAAGRVAKIVAKEDEVIAKGGLLCQIDESAKGEAAKPAAATTGASGASAPQQAAPTTNGPTALASPSVKKLALEHGVDVHSLSGTGDHGKITQADVLKAANVGSSAGLGSSAGMASSPSMGSYAPPQPKAEPAPKVTFTAPAPAPVPYEAQAAAAQPSSAASELSAMLQATGGYVPPIPNVGYGKYSVPPYTPKPGDEVVPFSRRRRITADHMVYSKLVSPHVVTVAEVDLAATSRMREQHKDRFKKEGIPLTFLAFICAATVKSLREHPGLNGRVLENAHVLIKEINLGVAVETPGGLVVPSIKHADQLSLRGIAASIDELATRARAGKVTADDLSGTTFSVSNPGLKGNLFGGAIISQPNVGILRMGEIKKRPVVVTRDGEDSIAIHPVMFIALSYDHRVVDGVLANSFLWRVSDILSRGEFDAGS